MKSDRKWKAGGEACPPNPRAGDKKNGVSMRRDPGRPVRFENGQCATRLDLGDGHQ